MFPAPSQPVRSNKPTPMVCVIRLLIVIAYHPEFKLHPATRSQSSSGATFARTGNLTKRHSEERQRQLAKAMATGCSLLSAFVFTSAPLVVACRRGIEKQRAFSCVRSHTPQYQT